MNEQEKINVLNELRAEFTVFMNRILKFPGAPMQKQQAFLRFDEGHMWLQNSVLSYNPPEQLASDANVSEPVVELLPVSE